jgi:PTH1 family peptidyl-tRNA hydrolase
MPFGRRRAKYEPPHDVQWLIVGLGNPGAQYADTPHNVGFDVIAKHEGMYGVGQIPSIDGDVALLKPLTYMNLSGRSVKPAMRALGLTPANVLVVHDEIDLDFGTIQIKVGGGLAGHNGLKSIAELLATRDFPRVRAGVGRPGPGDRRPIRDWILSSWDQPQSDVEQLVADASEVVRVVVERGVRGAMNLVNGRAGRPERG